MCHQCGRSGSWAQLEDHLSLRRPGSGRKASRLPPAVTEEPPPLPTAAARLWEAAQPTDSLEADTLLPALERLGLQVSRLAAGERGAIKPRPPILPWYSHPSSHSCRYLTPLY